MNILLIESSSKNVEFGYFDGKSLYEKKLNRESNADSLIYEIKKDFDSRGIKFSEIDIVSISNGPGSFTGLRIGTSVAKGICFALGCRLVEIPTLDVIANKADTGKIIVSLIFSNMKSNEFYYAEYRKVNNILERLSEHNIGKLENINSEGKEFFTNEDLDSQQFENNVGVINVSSVSGMKSQLELTQRYIAENKFADSETSEPFYIKNFDPVKP